MAPRPVGRSRFVIPGLFSGLILILLAFGLPAIGHAQTVTYTYDSVTSTNGYGRLTGVNDSSGTVSFSYDSMGRVVKSDKVVDGPTYTTRTSYDTAGRVQSVTYPDLSIVTYSYNGPALYQVSEGTTNYATYSGYNALEQPATVAFNNNVTTTYTYSNSANSSCTSDNFRLCTITTSKGGSTYLNLQYQYDSAGNVTKITDTINGNQTLVYDEQNRLTAATGPYANNGSSKALTYAYDSIGNMTCNSSLSTCSSASPNYTYGDPAHAHAVTSAGTNNYTYDTNGNMLAGAGRTMNYDPYNRLQSVMSGSTTTSFVYDGDGRRVKKTVNNGVTSVTTTYISQLYECTNGSCSKYVFASSQRIAVKTVGSSAVYYYHADQLGSSSVVTDGAGAKVQSLTYLPYGQVRGNTGSIDVTRKYTGQELDDSTGLYFYGARYYDPVLGRFISADSTTARPFDPQALNRYSYARNNPLRYTDP